MIYHKHLKYTDILHYVCTDVSSDDAEPSVNYYIHHRYVDLLQCMRLYKFRASCSLNDLLQT
jgi:hypothetical protein